MNALLPPSDPERELDDLRRRAYGRNPDIQVDPAALARLRELEASHMARSMDGASAGIDEPAADAAGARGADGASAAEQPEPGTGIEPEAAGAESPRSRWHRLTAARGLRGWLVAGALVAVLALANTAVALARPHPDATLKAIDKDPSRLVLSLLGFLGADVDPSSIRAFERYRGFEPWYSVEKQGQHCLMLVDPATQSVDGANCVPPGVDLFADIGEWRFLGSDYLDDLPPGSVIRFYYRGNSVDVFVYPAPVVD